MSKFLGKLKGSEHVEPKKFLALVLTDEVVQAAVWHVADGVTEITALGTPVEWDGNTGTTSELVTAVDATISSAVEGLAEEPNSIILGIPHSWTDKNGVLGVKREFISKIRKELELEAIGYVVITDSILSYLKMQEGTPSTSILIQVSRDELTLVLVRLGQIEAVETIGRGDDVVVDVTEGIARFKVATNLPSRIILFNSMHDLSDIIQNLLSVDWPKEFNFIHIPKIEALPKDVAIRALSVAGGSEVAKSLGFTVSEFSKGSDYGGDSSTGDMAESQVGTPKVGGVSPSENSDPDLLSAEEIGFSLPAEDVAPVGARHASPVELVGVAQTPSKKHHRVAFVMPKIKLPRFRLPKFKLNLSNIKSHWWIIGGSLVALGVVAFWLIWILPTAVVTVRVLPKALDQDVELTLSSVATAVNFSDHIVPASIELVTESGKKIMETTGKKTIGETAEGEVTIYNRTSASKNFPKGTTLSAGSLKFTIDQDVQVASKSAGSDYVDVPGKASIAVTAASIGKEGNIGPGTELTIMSFGKDSYVAKNDIAFAGGTSQEVRVVGKDDQKNLVKELTTELLGSLTEKSVSSGGPGTGIYLIPSSAVVDTVSYSAKVGEPADSLMADLTIKASLLKYKTDDVTNLVNSSIDQAVPTGYVRANLPATVDLNVSNVSDSGDVVKGNAKVQVSLLPVVDNLALQSSLRGKKSSAIESILSALVPGYSGAEVKVSPSWIPSKLKSIPLNLRNISVHITQAI